MNWRPFSELETFELLALILAVEQSSYAQNRALCSAMEKIRAEYKRRDDEFTVSVSEWFRAKETPPL